MVTLHHRTTRQPNLKKVLVWSFALHIAVLVAMSLSFSTRVKLSTPTVQIKLVGVPQPKQAAKKVEPEKVRTQDSAAPKEPPKEMKNMPTTEATSKFVTEPKPESTPDKKVNPIEAKERPPLLDKTPREKKVVKNEKDAKVVKNPEDFLDSLDAVLDAPKPAPKAQNVKADPSKNAGEGPQLQLNMTDEGVNSAIQSAINKNWLVQNYQNEELHVVVQIKLTPDGQLVSLNVVQSSGNVAYDNSLLRAIRKSVPLPIPTDKINAYLDFEVSY